MCGICHGKFDLINANKPQQAASFDDILNKAEDLGLLDDFMMIASAGLVVDQIDGNNVVESVSNINVDTKEEMISLVTYLMGAYSEDSEGDDTTNIDYWLNLN